MGYHTGTAFWSLTAFYATSDRVMGVTGAAGG